MSFVSLISTAKRIFFMEGAANDSPVVGTHSESCLYDKIEEIISISERNSRSLNINVKFHDMEEIGRKLTIVSLIEHNMLEGLETILLTNCDVNFLIRGQTPLHFAVQMKNLDMVQLLLKHKAHLEAKNTYKESALNVAVQLGHVETINYLLAQGADVNTFANDNVTPLAFALNKGDIDSVNLLESYGAQLGSSYLVNNI